MHRVKHSHSPQRLPHKHRKEELYDNRKKLDHSEDVASHPSTQRSIHHSSDVEERYSPPPVAKGIPDYTPSVIARVSKHIKTTSTVSTSTTRMNPTVRLSNCLSASQEGNTITVPSGQSQKKFKAQVVSSSSDSYSGSGSSSSGSSSDSDSSSKSIPNEITCLC